MRIDPARVGERLERLPFLAGGPVAIELRSPLTLLVGENGSGKTTLLEAIATRCGIQPGGGRSYAETEDDREATALSAAVDVTFSGGWRPRGLFLRADRFAETMAHAGRLPMPLTGEWRLADEQSRGEGVLSLLSARVEASERMLFILDEPETGLSPQRQLMLLALLDELHRDERSQAIVATHSPILLSHPGCDRLWVDEDGIGKRDLDDIPHWREMRRFMREPEAALRRLLPDRAPVSPAITAKPARRAPTRPVKLWVLSDLHLEAVPHPEAYRPKPPAFDVLVVAGDVWEGECRRALEVVARLAGGKPAVFVIGNHEVWGAELQEFRTATLRAAGELGITLLDDGEAELAGIHFVGGTLWTSDADHSRTPPDRTTGEPIQIEGAGGTRAMTINDMEIYRARTDGLIEASAGRPREARVVVVTHYPPHAAASCSTVSTGPVAAWIHGHVHHTADTVRLDGLRVVCNAAGPGFGNLGYLDDMVIEI